MKRILLLIFSIGLFAQTKFEKYFDEGVKLGSQGFYKESNLKFVQAINEKGTCLPCLTNISYNYIAQEMIDSAKFYFDLANQMDFSIETGNLAIELFLRKNQPDSLCYYAQKTDTLYSDIFNRYDLVQDTIKNPDYLKQANEELEYYRETFKNYMQYYDLYCDESNANYYLERAKANFSNPDIAKKYLEYSEEKFPNNYIIKNYLAEIYFYKQDYNKSIKYYEKLILNKIEFKNQLSDYFNIDKNISTALFIKLIKNKSICEYSLNNINNALLTINDNLPINYHQDYKELYLQKMSFLWELGNYKELEKLITELESIELQTSDIYYMKFLLEFKNINIMYLSKLVNEINSLDEQKIDLGLLSKEEIFILLKYLDKGKSLNSKNSIYVPNIFLFSSILHYNLGWQDYCDELKISSSFGFEPAFNLSNQICK